MTVSPARSSAPRHRRSCRQTTVGPASSPWGSASRTPSPPAWAERSASPTTSGPEGVSEPESEPAGRARPRPRHHPSSPRAALTADGRGAHRAPWLVPGGSGGLLPAPHPHPAGPDAPLPPHPQLVPGLRPPVPPPLPTKPPGPWPARARAPAGGTGPCRLAERPRPRQPPPAPHAPQRLRSVSRSRRASDPQRPQHGSVFTAQPGAAAGAQARVARAGCVRGCRGRRGPGVLGFRVPGSRGPGVPSAGVPMPGLPGCRGLRIEAPTSQPGPAARRTGPAPRSSAKAHWPAAGRLSRDAARDATRKPAGLRPRQVQAIGGAPRPAARCARRGRRACSARPGARPPPGTGGRARRRGAEEWRRRGVVPAGGSLEGTPGGGGDPGGRKLPRCLGGSRVEHGRSRRAWWMEPASSVRRAGRLAPSAASGGTRTRLT